MFPGNHLQGYVSVHVILASKHSVYFRLDLFFLKSNWQVSISLCSYSLQKPLAELIFWACVVFASTNITLKKLCIVSYSYMSSFTAGGDLFKQLWSSLFLWSKLKPEPGSKVK